MRQSRQSAVEVAVPGQILSALPEVPVVVVARQDTLEAQEQPTKDLLEALESALRVAVAVEPVRLGTLTVKPWAVTVLHPQSRVHLSLALVGGLAETLETTPVAPAVGGPAVAGSEP